MPFSQVARLFFQSHKATLKAGKVSQSWCAALSTVMCPSCSFLIPTPLSIYNVYHELPAPWLRSSITPDKLVWFPLPNMPSLTERRYTRTNLGRWMKPISSEPTCGLMPSSVNKHFLTIVFATVEMSLKVKLSPSSSAPRIVSIVMAHW